MTVTNHRRNKLRTRSVNVALVLLFTAGSLWLADLGFRAYERHFLLPQYPDPAGTSPVNLTQLSYNEGLVPRASPAGEFRVLSFGDSFAYSIMEPARSYGGVVQQKLAAALPGQTVRVVNLGEPATGPNSFRAAYDFWSQVFEHQAVLFHIYLGNDVLDDAYLHAPLVWEPNIAVLEATHPLLAAGSNRVPARFPLRMLDYAYAAWLTRRNAQEADLPPGYNRAALADLDQEALDRAYFTTMDNFSPERLPLLFPGYQQVYLLLQRAQAIADAGIPVAVVLGPSEPMVNDTLRKELLQQHSASPGAYDLGLPARIIGRIKDQAAPDVPMLDLTVPFRVTHQETGEKLYFRRNTHWDEAGNRLAGERIADFLLRSWFGQPGKHPAMADPAWPGPELVSRQALDSYLLPLFTENRQNLPEVNGAARALQLFDGVIGDPENWAMAELNRPIELRWSHAGQYSAMQLHLYGADDRRYGFLLEAQLTGGWQVVADHRESPLHGLVKIDLPDQPILALRLTGTSNSNQAVNPSNAYIHIHEIELLE